MLCIAAPERRATSFETANGRAAPDIARAAPLRMTNRWHAAGMGMLTGLVVACHRPRDDPDVFEALCLKPSTGTPNVDRHESAVLDTMARQSHWGRLTIQVQGGEPIETVHIGVVHLTADNSGAGGGPAKHRAEFADRAQVEWDSLPAGRYQLLVHGLGYVSLQRSVTVRAGGRDTLVVTLRTRHECSEPPQ